MAIVEFESAGVVRPGGVETLRDFTLAVNEGSVVAFVGRSGAGKTTALKLVNRLLEPTTGEVRVEGRSTRAWDTTRLRRRIGYVFQDVGLFPHMSVARNTGIALQLERWPATRIRERVSELLRLVGLDPDEFAARLPHELSGGQRQRVGVARALALSPPLLLMDEPFGALDSLTRFEVRQAFAAIRRQLQTTVLIVTHDLGEACALADRIAVIDAGRLVACDSPAAIAHHPHPLVAALLAAASPPSLD